MNNNIISKKMNPSVSIIIPVYNVESAYLIPCIESVLNQTFRNIEILLIDDKSTFPDVLTIFRQFKQKDSRIVIIEKDENEGVSFCRQCGINMASGQYLLFIDGDDYITEDCVEVLVEKAIQSDADMVIGDMCLTYKDHKVYTPLKFDLSEPDGFIKALLNRKCGGVICGRLIKTEKIRPLELPNVYMHCNDTMVNFLIASKNFKVERIMRPLYNWVQRKTSDTNTKSQKSIEHAVFSMKWINGFLSEHYYLNNLENEIAYYNLTTWSLLVANGIRKPYSSIANEYRNNIYNSYWKNKWAKNQLNLKKKLIILSDKHIILSIFYNTYAKFIKPFLQKL